MLEQELFTRFTLRVYRESLSGFMFASFPFDFEDQMWDLIVLVPEAPIAVGVGTALSSLPDI